MECKNPPPKEGGRTGPLHTGGAQKTGSCTRETGGGGQRNMENSQQTDSVERSHLLQRHAPDTMLPPSIRAPGAQTEAAVLEAVAGWGAGHRGRRLHLHGRDIEQGVAETRPVVGGIHTQNTPRLTWNIPGNTFPSSQAMPAPPTHTANTTCALELACPHALSRRSTLGAVGCFTTGLSAVAGQKDLPLVDAAVVFGGAANGAADTRTFWAVGAPLALQRRLKNPAKTAFQFLVNRHFFCEENGSVTCDGLENVFGCRARHSLQVFNLRH